MRRTSFRMPVLVIVALRFTLSAASSASAQKKSSVDVGVSWALLAESGIALPVGWVAAVAGHITDRLAIVGEVGGNYTTVSESGVDVGLSFNALTVQLGGGVEFQVSPRMAVRLQADLRWMTLQAIGSGWQ